MLISEMCLCKALSTTDSSVALLMLEENILMGKPPYNTI